MELTAEQKYLKALAEWLDIETIPKNRIQEASREYLDQFVSVNEKVEPEPAWKPEVGKLYKRKHNGAITEVIKVFLDNRESSKVAHKLIGVNYDICHAHCDYASGFLGEYEPIAELEGLESGDLVYGLAYQKYIHPWHITGITGSLIHVRKHGESAVLILNKHGFSYEIGSTQLFYRTADRAERFGRGDA